MVAYLKIAIAETSIMLRCGLENMLKHLPGLHIQIIDIGHNDILLEALKLHKPDILIINPLMPGFANTSVGQLRDETGLPQLKCIALLAAIVPDELVKQFDDYIYLYHDFDEIKQKLEALLHAPDEEEPDEDETPDEGTTTNPDDTQNPDEGTQPNPDDTPDTGEDDTQNPDDSQTGGGEEEPDDRPVVQ